MEISHNFAGLRIRQREQSRDCAQGDARPANESRAAPTYQSAAARSVREQTKKPGRPGFFSD